MMQSSQAMEFNRSFWQDVNDVILNSVALFFIVEIGDYLEMGWDRTRIGVEVAFNLYPYVTTGNEQVQVTLKTALDDQDDVKDADYQRLLDSDDKVYDVSVWKHHREIEQSSMLTIWHPAKRLMQVITIQSMYTGERVQRNIKSLSS
jgi:hypothetical protein